MLSNDEAKHVPVLIFANKQDLADSVKKEELVEILGIQDQVNRKPIALVKVQESSAVQDIGLFEGFEWVVERIVALGAARQAQ